MQPYQNLLFSGRYCSAMSKIKYLKKKKQDETSEMKNIRERDLCDVDTCILKYIDIYVFILTT